MAPEPQNGFGVFFLNFNFGREKCVFAEGFCEPGGAERGFLRGKRYMFVDKTWTAECRFLGSGFFADF